MEIFISAYLISSVGFAFSSFYDHPKLLGFFLGVGLTSLFVTIYLSPPNIPKFTELVGNDVSPIVVYKNEGGEEYYKFFYKGHEENYRRFGDSN